MFRSDKTALALTLITTLWGCGDDSNADLESSGELGGGKFIYECINDSDAFCSKDASFVDFPNDFAVGGTFRLSFRPPEQEQGKQSILAASSNTISHEGLEYTVKHTGPQGVYVGTLSGAVTDFLHLLGREIDHLEIADVQAADTYEEPVRLAEDAASSFILTPWSSTNELLAGALNYTWSVEDESVVEVRPQGVGERRAMLLAKKTGRTQLLVEVGGQTFRLHVTVGDGSQSDSTDSRALDAGGPPASQMDVGVHDSDGGGL